MSANTQNNAVVLHQANAMPAPTWGRLGVNAADIELPSCDIAAADAITVQVEGSATVAYETAETAVSFKEALERAAERFGHLVRTDATIKAADDTQASATQTDLESSELSAYQHDALELQLAYRPQAAFETGMGEAAAAYLADTACSHVIITVPARKQGRANITITGAENTAAIAAIDVVLQDDAQLDMTVLVDGQAEAPYATEAADATAHATSESTPNTPAPNCGIVGSVLRVCAGANARFNLTITQTADDAFMVLDDSGYFLQADARIAVRQVVLGGGKAYAGLAGEIAGDNANIQVETSYLGAREQVRDFNYELRHRGQKTTSKLLANGVLAGASSKVLRGTIDLVHGCKGSQGNEHETVLIADKRVVNKSVPVILCDEDDVAGNHGATIGHVNDQQLFYLMSRGVSPQAAEDLFIRAKLEDATYQAPNEATRAAVVRLAEGFLPDFAENL